MSDNNNKPKINVPRFNLTWLYVIIALIFAFLYFSGDEGSATKEVNYTEFQEMVSKGYADKIVAYDNNAVEMYIKPDHIVDVFKKDASKVGRSPSINVQIGSMEALDKFLDEQTKEGNFTGSIQYEKKSDYFSIILWNVLPFVFLIGIWMFAMRRMGGVEGTVRNIDIFYTRIVTTDNKVIVIPNGTLSNGNIINTSQEEYRLLILDFMVGYDAQISKVREVVLNLMEKDEGVCKDRPQSVNIDKLNPGRVRLQAKAWVTNKEYWDVRYRMLEAIKEELPKQGISLF